MKNHFSLHEREPGYEIAGKIVDLPRHGWSASRNEEYFGVRGYGVDMANGIVQRVYQLPGGDDLAGVSVAGYSIEPGSPLPASLQQLINSIQTKVDEFPDWS